MCPMPQKSNTDSRVVVVVVVVVHALQGRSQVCNSRLKVVAAKPGGLPGDTVGYICIDPEALIFLCGLFAHKSNVSWHERTNTGKKPYACSMCPMLEVVAVKPGGTHR